MSSEALPYVATYGDSEADERIIPVDCVPRVMSNADWRRLETGLTQRVKALNLFLEDVYGKARIVRDGVIPEDVVRGCPQYRTEMRGFSAPHGTWGRHLRRRPRPHQRRLPGARGQPARPLGRLLHAR